MPRPGSRMFTKHAVQRAMDGKAGMWGAPPGYYAVDGRIRKLSETEQLWAVRVRLFGGRTRHVEEVIFIREGGDVYGEVIFGRLNNGPAAFHEMAPAPERKPFVPKDQQHKFLLQSKTQATASMLFTPWLQSEDRVVKEDMINKVPMSDTAVKLGRTYYAVSRRRVILGITGYSRSQPTKEEY